MRRIAPNLSVLAPVGTALLASVGAAYHQYWRRCWAGARSATVGGEMSGPHRGPRRGPGWRGASGAGVLVAGVTMIGGCAEPASPEVAVVREVLDSGVVLLRYGSLPGEPDILLDADLEIGVLDGPLHEAFGEVKGIEAGADGEIYVLDAQARAIRVFGPDGAFLRTIGGPGEGPGEITAANGLVRAADGTLWVQDHGRWQFLRLAPDGEEVARVPMHIRAFAYLFNGALDDAGRLWKPTSHSVDPQVFPPEAGLNEGRSRIYLAWYDPETEAVDSVFVREERFRGYVESLDGGWRSWGVPHWPRSMTVVDPTGGFWTMFPDTYRVARLDEAGDTVTVVEADLAPEATTAEDRRAFLDQNLERSPDSRRSLEEVVSYMPETKPVADQLTVDDEGRLWVRRLLQDDELPVFDVFSEEGEHRATLGLAFRPAPGFPIRVRDGFLYTLRLDDFDVHRVVRARVPPTP